MMSDQELSRSTQSRWIADMKTQRSIINTFLELTESPLVAMRRAVEVGENARAMFFDGSASSSVLRSVKEAGIERALWNDSVTKSASQLSAPTIFEVPAVRATEMMIKEVRERWEFARDIEAHEKMMRNAFQSVNDTAFNAIAYLKTDNLSRLEPPLKRLLDSFNNKVDFPGLCTGSPMLLLQPKSTLVMRPSQRVSDLIACSSDARLFPDIVPNSLDRRFCQEVRMTKAYQLIYRLERAVRDFIVGHLSKVFGPKWILTNIPSDVRGSWNDKRRHAEKASSVHGDPPQPLIEYADMMDYEKIIIRKDNWEASFRFVFQRRETVTECFYRLHILRLSTMHSRPLSEQGYRMLQTECEIMMRFVSLNTYGSLDA